METGPFRLIKEISQAHQLQTQPKHQASQPKKKIFATANRFDVLSQPDNDNDKINDNHNTC